MAYHKIELLHPFDGTIVPTILPEINGWILYGDIHLVHRQDVETECGRLRARIPNPGPYKLDFECCMRQKVNQALITPGPACLRYQHDLLVREQEKNRAAGVLVKLVDTKTIQSVTPVRPARKKGLIKPALRTTAVQAEPQCKPVGQQVDHHDVTPYITTLLDVAPRTCPAECHETKSQSGNGKSEESDKALKADTREPINLTGWRQRFWMKYWKERKGFSRRRNEYVSAASKLKFVVDKETYWYLVAKLMYVPRDTKFIRTANIEYDKYIKKFDLSRYTMEDRAHMKARVIAAVVAPIPETLTVAPCIVSNKEKIRKLNKTMQGKVSWRGHKCDLA